MVVCQIMLCQLRLFSFFRIPFSYLLQNTAWMHRCFLCIINPHPDFRKESENLVMVHNP